jgi:hypothetical protein
VSLCCDEAVEEYDLKYDPARKQKTMNEQFQQAARKAEEKYTVVQSAVSESAVYLTAEAGTGSATPWW